jgi:polysaccharide export outer membrane protein/exopolysaccharide production protein ExoF
MRKPSAAALLSILLLGLAMARPAVAAVYTLGTGDQVRVKVHEWRSALGEVHEWSSLTGDFAVAADGNVSIPIIGMVPATDHTVDELAMAIATRLHNKLGLASLPQASVEIIKYRPFYILGRVKQPGEYPFRPSMTVRQAVAIAGGLFSLTEQGILARRAVLTTAGDLRVLELDLNALLARRARLKAELSNSSKVEFPRELLQQQNDPKVAQLIEQEQAIFAARRDSLRSETDALTQLKEMLKSQVAALRAKMEKVDQQLNLLKAEVESQSSLVKRGLAVAPREFSLRQAELQTEGHRLDLDAAILRAREDIGKADHAMIELANKRRDAALTELAQVESKLSETAARIRTGKVIIEQEEAGPDLAEILGEQGSPVYSIIRRSGENEQKHAASEASIVQPGDTIEVTRAEAAPLALIGSNSNLNRAATQDSGSEPSAARRAR